MRALSALFLTVLVASVAYADFDYGDAPGYDAPGSEARHESPYWQRLGKLWDADSGAGGVDASDDGVSWSVDGGQTWGHAPVTVGQDVTFRYDVRRWADGNHNSDVLMSWVDWDQSISWDHQMERILFETWAKDNSETNTDLEWLAYQAETGAGPMPYTEIGRFFYSTLTVPDAAALGETWLRARIACNTSLPWGDPAEMTAYDYLRQGEVEDYKLTVIPEPTTLGLLALGGLALLRRRHARRRRLA